MDINIAHASREDAESIFTIQQLAYQSEARLYNDWNIPPLRETLEQLRTEFDRQTFLKAVDGEGWIAGSVRVRVEADSTGRVGRLIVHPDFQGRGIGTALLRECERRISGVRRWELFTGARSGRNLELYRRLGYAPFHERKLSERVTLVFLEKSVPGA